MENQISKNNEFFQLIKQYKKHPKNEYYVVERGFVLLARMVDTKIKIDKFCENDSFSIPFMNRVDNVVVFKSLDENVSLNKLDVDYEALFMEANIYYEIENNLKYLKCDTNNHFALIGVTDQEATQYLINKNTVLIAGDAFFKCKNFEDIEIPKIDLNNMNKYISLFIGER